jgi:DNA-directed RNA polymerase specialized sigma24 family protein
MPPTESVMSWFALLQAGDTRAAQELWNRYFPQLVVLARKRLKNLPTPVADEQDVALSAFNSFCQRAEAGRFPQLGDSTDLWKLLVVITARKAADLIKWTNCACRDPRRLGGDLENVIGREPTPDFAAEVADEYQRLLDQLPTEEMRQIAVLKMQGNTDKEIVAQTGFSLSKVQRKLQVIRCAWEEDCPSGEQPKA